MKKRFTPQQKATVALAAMKGDKTVNEVGSLFGVHPTQVNSWRKYVEEYAASMFTDKRTKEGKAEERLVEDLYRTLGKREHELEWLKKVCPSLTYEEKRSCIERDHPHISLRSQCALLEISRSGLSYVPVVSSADVQTMNALDLLYTEHPFYGSRRMQFVLARDKGIACCRERIKRLMRVMGFETIYPKAKPRTSDPNTSHRIYPYLLGNTVAAYPNHIWGTDITYIRLEHGFCYLVAIIDWYSRYVIAWELAPTLEIGFCLDNLETALLIATPQIHNSDQGSHFTSPQYIDLLIEANASISMDGRGRCMDNIFTERLWRTVKYEDVYIIHYTGLDNPVHLILRIQRTVKHKDKVSEETAYFISSLGAKTGAKVFNEGIRSHWNIESFHYIKDVIFGEDRSKVKTNNAPCNYSLIRNLVINIFRKNNLHSMQETIEKCANNVSFMMSLI